MKETERKQTMTFREYLKSRNSAANVFRWVRKEIITKQSQKYLTRMLVSLVAMIVLASLQPAAVSYIFKGLSNSQNNLVIWGIAIVGVLIVLQKICERFQQENREWVFGINWRQLDDKVNSLFFGKSIAQHVHGGRALSVSSIEKGRSRLVELQSVLLFEGIPTVIQLFISLLCLLILDWVSGLVMFVVFLIYTSWGTYLNYRVVVECTPVEKDFRKGNHWRMERMEHLERVKVNDRESGEVAEISEFFKDVIDRDRTFWIWFIRNAHIRSMINVFGKVGIMAWGAWLVYIGDWNIGLLYPLYSWSAQVADNLWRLGEVERRINFHLPAVTSMIEALSIDPAIKDIPEAVSIDHSKPHCIHFLDVTHVYPESEKTKSETPPAIVKVNFTIEPGEKVALLGESGAGKTTLMKALLRFDDPTSGNILVDGGNLKKITQASWKRGIGYIAQHPLVFDGTIRYNLMYGLTPEEKANMTDEKLWKLMDRLQIDFKERLTSGLDTVVGKNGLKLSGGQSQRLLIGAAVIKKPWLLVVDEATSSLDSTTEKKVQAGLQEALTENTSALFVAHRLDTVHGLCSKFVVLKPASEVKNGDGQVEAIAGSFEELHRISPTFRRLADDQGIVIDRNVSHSLVS
ncbi:hypothetical protein COB55_01630 [Candidatus Wolfebacteria bacterium]|nr:MAG: hypothetical protein COB55_01630 [Candidatus Wolfebacteria bacterium]